MNMLIYNIQVLYIKKDKTSDFILCFSQEGKSLTTNVKCSETYSYRMVKVVCHKFQMDSIQEPVILRYRKKAGHFPNFSENC